MYVDKINVQVTTVTYFVGMINILNFIDEDKEKIKSAYKAILLNLKDYLKHYDAKDGISYSKIFFKMLHNGFFSMNGIINFDNDYDYLGLPLEISQGVQVMYGICCCRHATEFLYNLLCILSYNPSLLYIYVNNIGVWRKVNSAIDKANHQAILLNDKYIIDPANKFILQIRENEELRLIDSEYLDYLEIYQEPNITVVGNMLEKYYTYKKLGIKNVYS